MAFHPLGTADPDCVGCGNDTDNCACDEPDTTEDDDQLIERLLAAVDRAVPGSDAEHAAQVVRVVLDELEALQAEADAAAEEYANDVIARTGLKGMDVQQGRATLHLVPPHDLVGAIAQSLAEYLRDAENYAEADLVLPPAAPDGGPPEGAESVSLDIHAAGDPEAYTLTVQRRWRKTPHQLRREAEDERDRLRDQLAEAHQTIRELTGDTSSVPDEALGAGEARRGEFLSSEEGMVRFLTGRPVTDGGNTR